MYWHSYCHGHFTTCGLYEIHSTLLPMESSASVFLKWCSEVSMDNASIIRLCLCDAHPFISAGLFAVPSSPERLFVAAASDVSVGEDVASLDFEGEVLALGVRPVEDCFFVDLVGEDDWYSRLVRIMGLKSSFFILPCIWPVIECSRTRSSWFWKFYQNRVGFSCIAPCDVFRAPKRNADIYRRTLFTG